MIKNLFLAIVLLCIARMGMAQSDLLTKSYQCQAEQTIISGINCCLDQMSEGLCRQLIADHLDDSDLNRILTTKELILSEQVYGYKENPNCHWNALSFHYPEYAPNPAPMVDLMLYRRLLQRDFIEIDEAQAQSGDLIVYYEYDIKQREMIEVNGKPQFKWVTLEGDTITHSAIYLENYYVFQKENLDSSIFSLGTLENVRELYHSVANQKPSMHQAKVKYRLYRHQ